MGMLWRRFNFNARAVGAELVNPGEPGQPITLPAITVTLAVPSLDYQAAQGTLVASLPPVPAGATRTIAGDSRLALNGGKTSVVVGSGALSPGATLTAIITDTLAGATNSPVSKALSVAVTSVLPVEDISSSSSQSSSGTGSSSAGNPSDIITTNTMLMDGDVMMLDGEIMELA